MEHRDTMVIEDSMRFFQKIIISMAAPWAFGRELESDSVLFDSICTLSTSTMQNAYWFYLFPKSVHSFVKPFLSNTRYHRKVMQDHLVPIIRQRRAKMAEAAAQGKSHALEMNILQRQIECVKPDGAQYSEEEIVEGLMLILLGVSHNTPLNMAMIFYWLLARPDLKERLELEIEEVLGNGPITQESLDSMEFLNNFLYETLRQGQDMLAIRKKALADFTFANGYKIPEGRMIITTNWQLNMGLDAGSPRAEIVDPSMIEKKSLTTPAKDFIIFGMGRNLCPGRFAAVQQMKMVLILLLQRYEIGTVSGETPQPVHYGQGFVAEPCNDPIFLKRKK
ncbi:hypothetical protein EC973_001580 [Apophysomyces ossiformis]|uniref:Cytochrome P450 n=1 Tax=Apophysomyces ossiformis TaxID=679940 RepID=A0A8H7BJE1_9FUNG|nr:hypothetical protein EC973_001580 [Apophysomyces ossiformis]